MSKKGRKKGRKKGAGAPSMPSTKVKATYITIVNGKKKGREGTGEETRQSNTWVAGRVHRLRETERTVAVRCGAAWCMLTGRVPDAQ